MCSWVFSQASAARMPGPPAFESTATLGPRGRGRLAKASARKNSDSRSGARTMPHWRKAAAQASSDPAMAPVWELAALAPAFVDPALSMMTGFLRLTSRATRTNSSPLSTFSM